MGAGNEVVLPLVPRSALRSLTWKPGGTTGFCRIRDGEDAKEILFL